MEWGRDRAGRATARRLPLALLSLLVMLVALTPVRGAVAASSIDIATAPLQRDLSDASEVVDTDERSVPVQLPATADQPARPITLTAKAPGPHFRWLVTTLTNSASEPREAVVTIPFQGFAGSGFLDLKRAGPIVYSVVPDGPGKIEPMAIPGETAYTVTVPAGGTLSLAFEVVAKSTANLTLWQPAAHDARKDYLSFFRGALLGISVLLAIALFALYGFRARVLFPVAGAFALTCVAFMMFEAGHLPAFLAQLPVRGLDLQTARAIIEGLMAAFLLLFLGLLSGLQRVSRAAGLLLLIAAGLAFAIPIFGLADPMAATTLARGVFAATAVLGIILMIVLWRMGEVKGDTAILSWSAILVWTIIAIAAAFVTAPGPSMSAILLAALAAVLMIVGFALAHHAFSQGYLSRHFFRDAGRHALALAGSRSYVWDWQPEEGELYVSPEIARALGQPADAFEDEAGEAFLEFMHPSDRSAYLATVEEAALDGRVPIQRQFRLRHSEGGYRWFELRARSITGHGLRAARSIGTMLDVTDAKLSEERLLQDAVYDVVTGLPNRALFMDRLERAIEAFGLGAPSIFVLLLDLDRFRLVSEALGHEASDALLSIIGRRLRSETGLADSIARIPGDKFAILFNEFEGGRDVERFANDLVKAVARPMSIDDEEFVITCSVGIARYNGEEIAAEKLMNNAAIALYEARRRGPETVELFNPAMIDDRAELVVLEAELRRALERGEIEVHYQPIARLSDMHLAGFEALVRWHHPKLGLLAPESFIGLAEETGMIREIGALVLNEAGRQFGIWQRAYRSSEPAFISVNISSSQLIEPGLLDDVKQIIGREGLLRGTFKIEVTESLVMQYPERAAQILERFRELGVGLACDAFGTGYSSLSSLRKLPFDTLKVDRSFIAPEAQEQRASVILGAIISMAHELGLTVVGEGIENQEQVDRLGEFGCDFGQGIFLGKPMSAKQVNDALAGLPYASTTGRTAITWLWERSVKDPPASPRQRNLTGRDLGFPDRPVPQPPEPGPRPAARPDAQRVQQAERPQRPPPTEPVPPPEKAEAVAEAEESPAEAAPAPEPAPLPPAEPLPDATPISLIPADELPLAEDVPESPLLPTSDVEQDEEALLPPGPRRRKRQRRLPVLDDPEV